MNQSAINTSRLRTGAFCTWIVAGCYFFIVLFAFLSPTSVASYVTSSQYFIDFHSYRYDFVILKILLAVANAALIGVIVALYTIRNERAEGVMTLFTILAIVGLGIGMYQSVVDASQVPHLAKQYENATPVIRHVIIAFGVANPAIYALSLGLPGLWFIVMSCLYRQTFTPFLFFLNLLWGIGNLTTVLAHLLVWIWLIYLVSAGALITSPFWAIWLSRFFTKSAK